jgi:hypothetical protein
VPRLLEIKKEDFAAHYNRSVEDKKSPAISAGLLVHIDEFKRVSNASASMFRQAYRFAMNADNITKRLKDRPARARSHVLGPTREIA